MFVAQTVHFEQYGVPITFLLDIVEVAASHTGKTLADAFAKSWKTTEYQTRYANI